MDRYAEARNLVGRLDMDRRQRGHDGLPPATLDAVAAYLLDLWAASERHGVTPASIAWTTHLPRAALWAFLAPQRRREPIRPGRKGGG